MEKKGSYGWGIVLALAGTGCFFLGWMATSTIVFAFVGIPMMVIGFPLMIWGNVLVFRARRVTARQVIQEGVASGLKEGLAAGQATPQLIASGQGTEVEIDLSQFTKKCLACAEQIKLEALVCRFCGQKFDEKEVQDQVEVIKAKHTEGVQDEDKVREKLNLGLCPKCEAFQNFVWAPEVVTCQSCSSAFPRRLVA